MTNKLYILVIVSILLLFAWMFVSNEKTSTAYGLQVEFAAKRIAILDSTIQSLRDAKQDIERLIEDQDSLIATLEFRGKQLRNQVREALANVDHSFEPITYNETDSTLVELLRSVYSERTSTGN